MIGEILGDRYELIEVIGEGGMAIVYKAKDKKLNRLVAVKILKKEFSDNKDIAEKFKREATAIANLSDTNIVNVLDVGHEDEGNIDYFVMEYVSGKTLKDFIVFNGKLNYTTAIEIAIQIAKALDCAHRNNIIHRDIKPQNILVTENGDVKVTDFGIAIPITCSAPRTSFRTGCSPNPLMNRATAAPNAPPVRKSAPRAPSAKSRPRKRARRRSGTPCGSRKTAS